MDPDTAIVRWVHSSEVYEMGGLLAGGELLLTTGAGAAPARTAPAGGRPTSSNWPTPGCSALALEVGRSCAAGADRNSWLQTARRRGMVLLALHEVVPFARMVEDFHELVVRQRAHAGGRSGWGDLAQVVIDGRGLRALLDEVSRAAGSEVELRDRDEQLMERSADRVGGRGRARWSSRCGDPQAWSARCTSSAPRPGSAGGRPRRARWPWRSELGRAGSLGQRPGPSQSLVSDLCAASPMPGSEVTDRLADLGWPPADGRGWQPIAVAVEPGTALTDVVPALEQALRTVSTSVLAGIAGSRVVAAVRGWTRPGLARAGLTEAHAELARAPGRRCVRRRWVQRRRRCWWRGPSSVTRPSSVRPSAPPGSCSSSPDAPVDATACCWPATSPRRTCCPPSDRRPGRPWRRSRSGRSSPTTAGTAPSSCGPWTPT